MTSGVRKPPLRRALGEDKRKRARKYQDGREIKVRDYRCDFLEKENRPDYWRRFEDSWWM